MTSERHERVAELFLAVTEKPPDERRSFLAQACGDDHELRVEVESLLDHDDVSTLSVEVPPSSVHRQIGRFETRTLIGIGGMGTVYEAVQEHPHRLVALKVLRHGAASPSAMKRFRHEAEVLGRLRHPNIAQIHDAGTFDEGEGAQPYFAMELVKGEALVEYAEANELGTRERLKLFVKVCDAVQYAHHKGVIHRDLKPDNILMDDRGEPKILDFGIARVTGTDIQATTLRTDIGQLIGTVPYMSPEQVTGDPTELDTRSDVYSLGVVLYQLLCGRLPHDLRDKSIPEAARIIREDDPTPLSSVNRVYRGDIDTIVAKALEKDKTRRYQAAAELAADVRHYLADEPIVARPPSTFYQFRKFARRNRVLVGSFAAVFLALATGAAISTYFAVGKSRQAMIAETVNDFFRNEVLGAADPWRRSGVVSVQEMLDEASKKVEGRFQGAPLIEASIRLTLGVTYRSLSSYEDAESHIVKAHELFRSELGDEHPLTIDATYERGVLAMRLDRLVEAEQLLGGALDLGRRELGEDHPVTMHAKRRLGTVLRQQGRYDEAENLLVDVLRRQQRLHGPEHSDTLSTMLMLATLYLNQRRYDMAEQHLVKVLEVRRRDRGENHPSYATALNNLGWVYREQGRHGEAEPLIVEALQLRRAAFGHDHHFTLWSLNNLASLYFAQDRYEEAEPLFIELTERRRKTLSPNHRETLGATLQLARVQEALGKNTQAEQHYRAVVEGRRSTLGPEKRVTLRAMNLLAWHLKDVDDQEKLVEAESVAREATSLARGTYGQDDDLTVMLADTLAVILSLRGNCESAVNEFQQVATAARRSAGDKPWCARMSCLEYGRCLLALERFEEAETMLLAAVDAGDESAREVLADLHDAWDKPEKAAKYRDGRRPH